MILNDTRGKHLAVGDWYVAAGVGLFVANTIRLKVGTPICFDYKIFF